MWTIRQNGDTWELLDASGAVLSTHARYEEALAVLGDVLVGAQQLAVAMTEGGGDGLLPETWVAPVAFLSEPTGDGRDFTDTVWSWRDPNESLLPLMLHTETDVGHFGAELAGFVTDISQAAGVGQMAGRFYDTEEGRAARDLLLAGRRFGVSVDPGGGTTMDFRCTETDEEGFCVAEDILFPTYEVIGLTMTPFPGFATAHIILGDPTVPDAPVEPAPPQEVAPPAAAAVDLGAPCHECEEERTRAAAFQRTLVAAGAPIRPPAAWFTDPQFSRLTAPRYEADGEVYGHLAPWGQCHTGSQLGECVMTPRSLTSYASFRTGYVECDDGSEVAVGQLSVGGGHASEDLSYRGAIAHYDNVAHAFADVTVGEDAFGIWFHGALRPGVSEQMLRVVRASPPSGDWRPVGMGLELVAACSVTSQGFPVARVASGGRVLALVAAGQPIMAALAQHPSEERLDRLERKLAEMQALASAPARARLLAAGTERQRDRLRALAPSA